MSWVVLAAKSKTTFCVLSKIERQLTEHCRLLRAWKISWAPQPVAALTLFACPGLLSFGLSALRTRAAACWLLPESCQWLQFVFSRVHRWGGIPSGPLAKNR